MNRVCVCSPLAPTFRWSCASRWYRATGDTCWHGQDVWWDSKSASRVWYDLQNRGRPAMVSVRAAGTAGTLTFSYSVVVWLTQHVHPIYICIRSASGSPALPDMLQWNYCCTIPVGWSHVCGGGPVHCQPVSGHHLHLCGDHYAHSDYIWCQVSYWMCASIQKYAISCHCINVFFFLCHVQVAFVPGECFCLSHPCSGNFEAGKMEMSSWRYKQCYTLCEFCCHYQRGKLSGIFHLHKPNIRFPFCWYFVWYCAYGYLLRST